MTSQRRRLTLDASRKQELTAAETKARANGMVDAFMLLGIGIGIGLSRTLTNQNDVPQKQKTTKADHMVNRAKDRQK